MRGLLPLLARAWALSKALSHSKIPFCLRRLGRAAQGWRQVGKLVHEMNPITTIVAARAAASVNAMMSTTA
jgi:hypothetical protein